MLVVSLYLYLCIRHICYDSQSCGWVFVVNDLLALMVCFPCISELYVLCVSLLWVIWTLLLWLGIYFCCPIFGKALLSHCGTAFLAVSTQSESPLPGLPAVRCILLLGRYEPHPTGRLFPWIPLPGTGLSFMSPPLRVWDSCIWILEHTHKGRELCSHYPSGLAAKLWLQGGLLFLPFPPLTNFYIISSVFLRYNMSNELYFSVFFQANCVSGVNPVCGWIRNSNFLECSHLCSYILIF